MQQESNFQDHMIIEALISCHEPKPKPLSESSSTVLYLTYRYC